jgi:hypothetical protein
MCGEKNSHHYLGREPSPVNIAVRYGYDTRQPPVTAREDTRMSTTGARVEVLGGELSQAECRARVGVLVFTAMATMSRITEDSSPTQVCADVFNRLAIELAETVGAVTRLNGQATDKLARFDPVPWKFHESGPPQTSQRSVSAESMPHEHAKV